MKNIKYSTSLQDYENKRKYTSITKKLQEAIDLAEKYETFVFHYGSQNKNIFLSNTKNVLMHKKVRSTLKGKPNSIIQVKNPDPDTIQLLKTKTLRFRKYLLETI